MLFVATIIAFFATLNRMALAAQKHPTQRTLDQALEAATRVVVLPGGFATAGPPQPLLDCSDPQAFDALRKTLAIVESPDSFWCACPGGPDLALYAGDKRLSTITLHHGKAIVLHGWDSQAWLRDNVKVLDWLADHGVPEPRREFQEDERRGAENLRAEEAWRAAIPPPLRRDADQWMNVGAPDAKEVANAEKLLTAAYRDKRQMILALFEWFGSSGGRWSGFPSYESFPEFLLLRQPIDALIDAASHDQLTKP